MAIYTLYFILEDGGKHPIKSFDMSNIEDNKNMMSLAGDKYFRERFPDVAVDVGRYKNVIPKRRPKAYYSKRWIMLKKAQDDGFIDYEKLNPYQRAMIRHSIGRGFMRLDNGKAYLTPEGLKYIEDSRDNIPALSDAYHFLKSHPGEYYTSKKIAETLNYETDYIRRRVYWKLRSYPGISEIHGVNGMSLGYTGG